MNLAGIARVRAALGNTWTAALLAVAAGLWIAAFAGFVLRYGPMLFQPLIAG